MTQVMEVVNQIRTHGENIIDQKMVEKILKSLPSSCYMLVTTIEEIKHLAQFSIEELTRSILNHESIIKGRNYSLENSFQTKSTIGRGKGNKIIGKRGR